MSLLRVYEMQLYEKLVSNYVKFKVQLKLLLLKYNFK